MSKLFVNKNDLFTPTPRKIRGLKEVGNHVVLKILGYQTCRFDVVFGKKSCRTEKNLLVTLAVEFEFCAKILMFYGKKGEK